MGKPKPKDKIKNLKGMKEYVCATCGGVIEKGEQHIAHQFVNDEGFWVTDRYHTTHDCADTYADLEPGEEIRE